MSRFIWLYFVCISLITLYIGSISFVSIYPASLFWSMEIPYCRYALGCRFRRRFALRCWLSYSFALCYCFYRWRPSGRCFYLWIDLGRRCFCCPPYGVGSVPRLHIRAIALKWRLWRPTPKHRGRHPRSIRILQNGKMRFPRF